MYFVIYMIANATWAVLMHFALNRLRLPNRMVFRCLTCGSKLYFRPSTYRWTFIDQMAWALVAWVVVFRFRYQLPPGTMITLTFVLLFAWAVVVRRTVRAYFLWRHPVRCQGGGHVKPVPQAT